MPIEYPLDILLLLPALAAAMFIHEAGHLVAAICLNFKVLGFALGPLHFQLLHGQSKLSWSPRTIFSASVSAVPSSSDNWRSSMISVVAAGPVATLAGAILIANLRPTTHTQTLLQLAFVQISLLLFALGLIPNSRRAALSNDARLLFDLAQQNEGAEEMELKVLLQQQVLMGIRPQDYATHLLLRLATWQGRPETEVAFAHAIARSALDSDHRESADLWDSHALSIALQCNPLIANAALASSACLDILIRNDPESSREKFTQVNFASLFPPCFEYRARAAQEIALGRSHRAPAFIIRAQYSLPHGVQSYNMERALLEQLHMVALLPRPARDKAKFAAV